MLVFIIGIIYLAEEQGVPFTVLGHHELDTANFLFSLNAGYVREFVGAHFNINVLVLFWKCSVSTGNVRYYNTRIKV